VSALHLPGAAHSARAGLRGPYGTRGAAASVGAALAPTPGGPGVPAVPGVPGLAMDVRAPLRLLWCLPRLVPAAGPDVASLLVREGM
jgi:hypothetical protein